jgi:hypothetical protein
MSKVKVLRQFYPEEAIMGRITPFNPQNPAQWRRQNEEVLQKIHDDALTAIIRGVLNLHELEHTGEWKKLGRRLDYADSTFEVYLQHHTTWSLKDFRLLEEAVFEHLDELNRNGLGSVLLRLKKLRNEKNPLRERRMKQRARQIDPGGFRRPLNDTIDND